MLLFVIIVYTSNTHDNELLNCDTAGVNQQIALAVKLNQSKNSAGKSFAGYSLPLCNVSLWL